VATNEQNVAQEVRSEYVDTMRKIYLSYFKSYSSRLAKLRYEEAATKDDLMGIEDTGASRGTGLFYKTPLKHKSTVFTIGNRGDVLSAQLEAPIIVPHAAHKTEQRVSVTAYTDTLHVHLEPYTRYNAEYRARSPARQQVCRCSHCVRFSILHT